MRRENDDRCHRRTSRDDRWTTCHTTTPTATNTTDTTDTNTNVARSKAVGPYDAAEKSQAVTETTNGNMIASAVTAANATSNPMTATMRR